MCEWDSGHDSLRPVHGLQYELGKLWIVSYITNTSKT